MNVVEEIMWHEIARAYFHNEPIREEYMSTKTLRFINREIFVEEILLSALYDHLTELDKAREKLNKYLDSIGDRIVIEERTKTNEKL